MYMRTPRLDDQKPQICLSPTWAQSRPHPRASCKSRPSLKIQTPRNNKPASPKSSQ